MNRPSLRPVLWLLVLTCFALPMDGARAATLQADSSVMEITNRLFELDLATVTGEASGTTEQDAMRNIRTIRAAEFAQLGAHSLRDLMRSQLNFDVSQDPILGSAMKMNGLGGRSVNVLVDGVPLTGRMNDNIDLSQITLDNVERIEIIDGP
ncbi:Plug domain-containing protein, partial [Flavobacteriales bacterium]|nr:Plug domain-containing protein [Flavobacteriales bacterium]